MQEYFSHNGLLLSRYEWSSGLNKNHKEVTRGQKARRLELKKGQARIIDESEWL
jgi:hypothetical protein